MNTKRDPLDEALASLPKSVQPTRDLWSGIRAEIESSPRAQVSRFLSPPWLQLAAGVLLVIAT